MTESSSAQKSAATEPIIAVDHDGCGFIHERRFGPDGVFEGETVLRNTGA